MKIRSFPFNICQTGDVSMEDETKCAIEGLMMQTLDIVKREIHAARIAVQTNPKAVPRGKEYNDEFRMAADFGLYVALNIVHRVQKRLEFQEASVN